MSVYRMIAAEKAQDAPVFLACELLGVSRSGFTDWATRAPSDRALSDAWLIEKIGQIHAENRRVYGAPRTHAELGMRHGSASVASSLPPSTLGVRPRAGVKQRGSMPAAVASVL